MSLIPGTTTEWEDIHVKLGNFEPRPSHDEMQDVAEEACQRLMEEMKPRLPKGEKNSDDESEEDEELISLRNERLAMLKSRAKYGEIYRIRRQEFIDQVTNCKDLTIVTLLDNSDKCLVLEESVRKLSKEFPEIKFVTGEISEIITGKGDAPVVMVYSKGEILHYELINVPVELDELRLWLAKRCPEMRESYCPDQSDEEDEEETARGERFVYT